MARNIATVNIIAFVGWVERPHRETQHDHGSQYRNRWVSQTTAQPNLRDFKVTQEDIHEIR